MPTVGPLLSEYRKNLRLSQLNLSLQAGVSARHISFIETGRSTPTRQMLLRLAEVLNLSLSDTNLLLNSAGFSALYQRRELGSADMAAVRHALSLMLENHNPYPAVVLDGSWNILMANSAQEKLLTTLGLNLDGAPINLLRLVFDHRTIRPLISNWETVASHLLRRLRKQVLVYSREDHQLLLNQLLAMDPPKDWEQPLPETVEGPLLTTDLRLGEHEISLFSTLSRFGTALDTGMEEVLVESYFPANEATKTYYNASKPVMEGWRNIV